MRSLRGSILIAAVAAASPAGADANADACPEGMVALDGARCIDAFEAHLEELDDGGAPVGVFPANQPPAGARVRAKSARGVLPQAFIDRDEARAACAGSGKRLCTSEEWLAACKGPLGTRYPYGTRRRAGACHDQGVDPLARVFRLGVGASYTFERMNDPRLGDVVGAVEPTGLRTTCQSELGAFDLVGNLHEWVDDAPGTIRGGYFLDTSSIGEGCDYRTHGHAPGYRDYSIGFRCCFDRPASP